MPGAIAGTIPKYAPEGLNQTNRPAPHPRESRGEPLYEIRRLRAEISCGSPLAILWFLSDRSERNTSAQIEGLLHFWKIKKYLWKNFLKNF